MREFGFGAVLIAAAASIVYGVGEVYTPAGWIAAGLSTAGLGWLVLGDVK